RVATGEVATDDDGANRAVCVERGVREIAAHFQGTEPAKNRTREVRCAGDEAERAHGAHREPIEPGIAQGSGIAGGDLAEVALHRHPAEIDSGGIDETDVRETVAARFLLDGENELRAVEG